MAAARDEESGWVPSGGSAPQAGFVRSEGDGDDHLVSFKQGYGYNEGHTLITDGDYSEDSGGFDVHHDHHGRKREEGGGSFSKSRGYYTGPGA
ncbi:MAG: hypothetical protein ACREX3_14180 [Gammaproteobacteria bacterium]